MRLEFKIFGWPVRLFAASLLVLAACSGTGDERQIRSATGAFYDVYMKLHPSGVPTKDQQAQFTQVISTQLMDLLNRAAAAETNYAEATKGESPPLIEGDLFTSLFEGADSYSLAQCENQKDSGECLIRFAHTDSRDRSKFEWKDRAYVVRENGRWVVDDIGFLGDWEFMHKGRLKDLLKETIEEAKNPAD